MVTISHTYQLRSVIWQAYKLLIWVSVLEIFTRLQRSAYILLCSLVLFHDPKTSFYCKLFYAAQNLFTSLPKEIGLLAGLKIFRVCTSSNVRLRFFWIPKFLSAAVLLYSYEWFCLVNNDLTSLPSEYAGLEKLESLYMGKYTHFYHNDQRFKIEFRHGALRLVYVFLIIIFRIQLSLFFSEWDIAND